MSDQSEAELPGKPILYSYYHSLPFVFIYLDGFRAILFIPTAGDYGLWPWRNGQSCDRDVAPHGREAGNHGLCPWGSIFKWRGYLALNRNF
jgi:hypothetical protein